jgi:protein-disulfide isomerase
MKPTHFFACAAALVAVAGCNSKQGDAATTKPVKLEQVAPPKGGDWTMVVNPSPAGGFIMGNPNAKVKLVEFGSLTCPHCREFDETGVPHIINTYVKSGQVSYEFRNYVRDAFDLAASLIARCNGAKGFFPLSRALYKDQLAWVGKIQATPKEQLQTLESLGPNQIALQAAKFAGLQDWAAMRGLATAKSTQCLSNQQFVELAKVAGFQDWAAARGVPAAKTNQCLANENTVNQLVQMTSDATSQYPDFPGTPTFILNSKMLDKTATWELLEPQLRSALGERG